MRKTIAIAISILLVLTICPVALAEGNSETVNHTVTQRVPDSLMVAEGTVQSGAVGDFKFLDQKVVKVTSSASGSVNSVRIQIQFPNMSVSNIKSIVFRLGTLSTASAVQREIKILDFTQNEYITVGTASAVAAAGLEDIELTGWASNYVASSGVSEFEVIFTSDSSFEISVDQLQLIVLYEATVESVQIQHYEVSTGQVQQGEIDGDSTFSSLVNQDGTSLQVNSTSNKVAWTTTIPLYHEKKSVQSLQIDYTGSVSAATNVLWLSLYRFDTENWEAIGVIPGSTSTVARTFVLSGDGVDDYISNDGDIRIRVYNSATQSFTRITDYLAVTAIVDANCEQEICSPSVITSEYGTSTGQVSALEHIDNQAVVSQSDSNRKIALQMQFNTGVDVDTIGEVTFAIRMKSQEGINVQYISLKNHDTGSFSVIKTLSGSGSYDIVRFTLDSLKDIEQYIDDDGTVVLRIYNSAPSATGAFTREIDFAQMTVTHGEFARFTIAQVSDVHELIGSENFKAIISEINTSVTPDFTIVSGDITDHGTQAQYSLYLQDKQLFTNAVYTLPGNHDVRWWNANGKNTFTSQIGPLYQSFNYGGIHFVLLDTTVNFELDAKVNKAQLEWLKTDLASIPSGMPVILFGHHPFKINNNVTGRHELLDAVKGSNVIAFMSGHVHYYGNVVEDGIPVNYITYVKDNANQEFVSIEFTENYYYIYKHMASDHSKTLWLTGRMDNTRQMDVSITSITPGSNSVAVSVQIDNAPDGVSSVQARIDNYGTYTQLSQNSDGTWSGTIDTSTYTPDLVAGAHFVGVEVFDNNGLKWTDYKDYSTTSNDATIKWVFETGDIIQSSATINGTDVFVGSNDGNVYCINLNTGVEKWRYETNGGIISKPAMTGNGNVVIGSGDKNVYCLDPNEGTLIWSAELGGSVLSDPLVHDNKVYTGCGDGKIYCLDAANGTVIWSYQTGGLMRQRPAVEDGVLYAFVRDTYIWYAIDAANGNLVWRGNANTDESLFVCGDVRPTIAGGKLWCIDAQNTRPGYLNMETGELVWTSTLTNVSSRGMATDGTLVFYVSNSGRQLTAFNASTNEIVWQKDLRYNSRDGDLQEMQIDSGLVYQDGVIFHVAERGRITAIDASNGTILWRIDAAGFPERVFWSTPEVNGNIIIADGIDGKVYAVEFTVE